MKIKKMTATYGRLEQAELTPHEGLTVIHAPNEGGKSTWASFLKSMLYGIDTRERDKGSTLADKNRFQPWSGAPMRGELELEWEGRDITLRRTSGRSAPMQTFEAVYTASGDPVPGLTSANVGTAMVGAGKEVFLRSALVGQNSTAVTNDGELERRIASLATSGQEDVSYTDAQRRLKDWKNRRRANRSNGLIPELEEELSRVESSLDGLRAAREQEQQARDALAALEEERRELNGELEIHRRLAQKELNRRYGQTLEELNAAQSELDSLPAPHSAYEGLTAREAMEKCAALEETARLQAEERARRLADMGEAGSLRRRRRAVKRWFSVTVPLLGFGGLALVIIGFILRRYALSYVGFGCMAAAVSLSIPFVLMLGRADRLLHELSQAAPPPEPDPVPDVEEYLTLLSRRELLEQEIRHCARRGEDLKAQGAREFDTLELLHTPSRSPDELNARLSALEREAVGWQSTLDRAIGALRTDPLSREERKQELLSRLEERTLQFDALDLALKGLEQANSVLRERFSPALNREAAHIFSRLTGGKYSALSLSRDFSAMASECGSSEAHGTGWLSAGTVDQLYLSVRLAVCSLTLPDVPLLLDDVLTAFDDSRAALALDCLKELSAERQILLFTCHQRDVRWAEAHNVPVIHM